MGCHTWFYKKMILEDFDEQFLKEKNLAFANKEISFAKEQYWEKHPDGLISFG